MTPEEIGYRFTILVMTKEFAEKNPEIHKQMIEMFTKDAREFAYNLSQQTKMSHDTYERLPEIKVPTLVIAGNADKIIPFENSKIIASRIPGAELVVIEGAGHTFIEAREEETEKTLDFLKRQI